MLEGEIQPRPAISCIHIHKYTYANIARLYRFVVLWHSALFIEAYASNGLNNLNTHKHDTLVCQHFGIIDQFISSRPIYAIKLIFIFIASTSCLIFAALQAAKLSAGL